MKKYKTFNDMFNDDEIVAPEEREQINFQVYLIGKMIDAGEEVTENHNQAENRVSLRYGRDYGDGAGPSDGDESTEHIKTFASREIYTSGIRTDGYYYGM